MDFCDYLENESPIVRDKLTNCWIKRLDEFVRSDSNEEKYLPIDDELEFYTYLFRFIEEDLEGIDAFRNLRIGFFPTEKTEDYPFDKRLSYCVIAALSIGDSRDSREQK